MTFLRLHMKPLLTILSLLLISLVAGCTRSGDERAQELSKPLTKGGDAYAASIDSLELLLPIIENGLYGFVTESGHVQIAPRFRAVGVFSQGLAPVRETGRYGYIDRNGAWAIAPRYDYATQFSEGHAVGFIDSNAYIIDKKGAALWIGFFEDASPFRGGLAVVSRHSDRGFLNFYNEGLINSSGFVVLRTGEAAFKILDSNHILMTPMHMVLDEKNKRDQMWYLMDEWGVIKQSLKGYVEAKVTYGSPVFVLALDSSGHSAATFHVFNLDGDKVGTVPRQHASSVEKLNVTGYFQTDTWRYRNGYYSTVSRIHDPAGRIAMFSENTYPHLFGESLVIASPSRTSGMIVYDTRKPDKPLHIKDLKTLHPVWADEYELRHSEWTDRYTNTQDYALLEDGSGMHVMDASGRISHALEIPQNFDILYTDSASVVTIEDVSEEWGRTMQFFDWDGSAKPIGHIDNVDYILAINRSVITAMVGDKLTHINRSGRIIWQSVKGAMTTTSQTDFDYKAEVHRNGDEDSARIITAQGIGAELRRHGLHLTDASSQPVQLFAYFADGTTTKGVNRKQPISTLAIEVIVANTSSDTVRMNSSDGRITLVMEARRKPTDAWREIEYLPDSWCGNSVSVSNLPNNKYWRYAATHYSGSDTVDCRMKLELDEEFAWTRIKRKYPTTIYSNTFTLTINPAQLWRITQHRATGLMDPY